MGDPRIKTTMVGSNSVPDWLVILLAACDRTLSLATGG